MNGGFIANRYACIQMKLRSGIVVVIIDLEIICTDGTVFTTQLCSKWFNKIFIFNGPHPAGTRAVNLEEFKVEEHIYIVSRLVFEFLNNSKGCMVFG